MSGAARGPGRCLLLSGGVGGAKLALGLDRVLPPGGLTVVANPGDDFEHLGLAISPDLDTLAYTLAGLVNTETGWGRAGETWNFMAALEALGGETWFRLGDLDLATHVQRTAALRAGRTLGEFTAELCGRLGVRSRLLPMTDDPVRTRVVTDAGELAFQAYFVRDRCAAEVRAVRFDGAAAARPAPGVLAALADPDLAAIVIAPSNPFLSIDPILAVPGVREALRAARAPRVAVSPIIAGAAVKGPTARLLAGFGLPVSAAAVARHYEGLLDGYVVDEADASLLPALRQAGLAATATRTLMASDGDKTRLARFTLDFAAAIPAR
jgi:LPPG:FO 2-phospho-L-lactate transferase